MLFFPQLSTGTAGQYPLRRVRAERIVTNRAQDFREVRYRDAPAAELLWSLSYRGLSDMEIQRLETLFTDAQGRLNEFVFLDPASNLLRWSEDFTKSVWSKQGGLAVTPGQADPWGTQRASLVANSGTIVQAMEQTVGVPAWFRYTISCWAKGSLGGKLTLLIGGEQKSIPLNGAWQRLSFSAPANPNATAESMVFGLQLLGSSSVELAGTQVEAQPAAGPYLLTTSQSGVIDQARFDQDQFLRTTYGPNDHATMLRIRARA